MKLLTVNNVKTCIFVLGLYFGCDLDKIRRIDGDVVLTYLRTLIASFFVKERLLFIDQLGILITKPSFTKPWCKEENVS